MQQFESFFLNKYILEKTLKTDNIHCVLRLQFQTVMIRILKKKSHCSYLKNPTLYNEQYQEKK